MTSPLKYQANTTSIVGSWDTWQGKTILSPTVTSILDGGIVMTVLSVETRLCFKGLEYANTCFLMYCYYFTQKKKKTPFDLIWKKFFRFSNITNKWIICITLTPKSEGSEQKRDRKMVSGRDWEAWWEAAFWGHEKAASLISS